MKGDKEHLMTNEVSVRILPQLKGLSVENILAFFVEN
jgi:hypothetical protein